MNKFSVALFVVSGFVLAPLYGQTITRYHHNTFWGRIVLSDKITPKLKWEVYLQDRTQNDESDKLNIFKHHQLTSYWLWLHYQATKDLRISVTPFCYFNTIQLLPQPPEIGNRGIREYRWAIQAEQTQGFRRFSFANRYSLEYRVRDLVTAGVYVPNYRIRYRMKFEYPVRSTSFALVAYDEIFLEFGKAVRNSAAVFNQNRLYAGMSYEILKNVKFSLAYMYLVQERPTGKAIDHANVLWSILTFENLFSQFLQKEKKND
jgi:hypothetical protein